MIVDNYDRCMLPYKTIANTVCPAGGLVALPKLGFPAALAATGACHAFVVARGNKKCLRG